MCEVHQLLNKFNSGVSSSTKTTASLFNLCQFNVDSIQFSNSVDVTKKTNLIQLERSSSSEDSSVIIQLNSAFVLFSSNRAQHPYERDCRLWCISVNVWCCCCFPGLPRVSHHLSDIKAGQHASVLHGSRAEIIVRHCVSTLILSHSHCTMEMWTLPCTHVLEFPCMNYEFALLKASYLSYLKIVAIVKSNVQVV